MELTPDICYRALTSRDPRFDGRFFAAVKTTGIYCRPVCPAPKPHKRNVTYFACAAAAEDAGFRPCLRCRPEATPGTPAWTGTATTVRRAMRMIDGGALDSGGSVEALAERLGMGARNLRRLFIEHVGASPKSVSLTRRIHFAKNLLDTTSLPVTEIVYAAGFSSIRRFNDAFRRTFGRSPSEVRSAVSSEIEPVDGYFDVRLPYREPFDWKRLVGFLSLRAIPGVERVTGNTYARAVRVGEAAGVIEVAPGDGRAHLCARIPVSLSRHAGDIAERVRHLFDLRAFPIDIADHLLGDRVLRPLVGRYPGLRVPHAWDPFETSVRAILGQQVTVAAATTIAGRVVERWGYRISAAMGHGPSHVFPAPDALARARLTGLGIPSGRAAAIREVAKAFRDRLLRFDGSMEIDEIVDVMTSLPGIGPWTAHYVAMRAGAEPDAFPAGDLALRRAALDRDRRLGNERQLIARAEAWRPWRSYATVLLWTHYTDKLADTAAKKRRQRPPRGGRSK